MYELVTDMRTGMSAHTLPRYLCDVRVTVYASTDLWVLYVYMNLCMYESVYVCMYVGSHVIMHVCMVQQCYCNIVILDDGPHAGINQYSRHSKKYSKVR
jgi:hypothetical protein